ncbi:scavenger receptor cysteine-rich domain-containing group B protein-like [Lytechinus variegatus]|uniref:scavenger receptor cysteine-rich domain-containing group B protein-like n=1 Tax=Lytechinus variegatus TaxID=7654 RepID=UPI001BB1EE0D|nr:scavenger receptor cysteine-rich domain-containing group B protein-like [Lytechinus variegatus]
MFNMFFSVVSIVCLVFFAGNVHFTETLSINEEPRVKSIRLVGGLTPWEGRVEILHGGEWGTVCDDLWDLADAHIVCLSMGYAYSVAALSGAPFGEGTGDILLDAVECYGNESSILDCLHDGVGIHDCKHDEDAGVRCSISAGIN